MKNILIDSDVILDVFLNRHPFVEHAEKLIFLCENNTIKGNLTPVMYSNLYYYLRKTAKREHVIAKLKWLSEITDILPMNRTVVEQSLHSEFKDFEDGLQNYAAVNCDNVDVIVTRNIKDYKHSELSVLSPATYLKLFHSK